MYLALALRRRELGLQRARALLEPRDHLGGMVSGGLGWTDFGKKEVIGGYSLEYYERAGKKYGAPIQWTLEPRVARKTSWRTSMSRTIIGPLVSRPTGECAAASACNVRRVIL